MVGKPSLQISERCLGRNLPAGAAPAHEHGEAAGQADDARRLMVLLDPPHHGGIGHRQFR